MSKIDETLKKIAAGISKTPTPSTQNTDRSGFHHDMAGDPACPICGGVGYLRQDVPVGHPDFGLLQACSCRQSQINQQVHDRLYSLSRLNELQHLTFDTFKPRGHIGLPPFQADSLERSYNQSRHFASFLEGWLLLQGGFGCGKTHLAAAIANFAVGLGVPTLFITVPDMLDQLRFAYGDVETTFEERFDEIRQAGLLVLDDFGTQNATPWAQEKLFQIINYRYVNRLPLVVTTNLNLEDIESRIRSRLQDPDLVTRVLIASPDYRNPADDTTEDDFAKMPHLRKCTFSAFDLRKSENLPKDQESSLNKAFQAAQLFAENPSGWLVFLGPSGCGKTHLAAAITNYWRDQGLPYKFTVVPDFLDHLRSAFNPDSTLSLDRRFQEARRASLLVLDDLSMQHTTAWAKEKIFQLINHRYNMELPTVITMLERLSDVDDRIRSRLLDNRLCRIYTIAAPNYIQENHTRRKSTRAR
jgi:DNA replication protein DnaC